jgi:hypothetical protein
LDTDRSGVSWLGLNLPQGRVREAGLGLGLPQGWVREVRSLGLRGSWSRGLLLYHLGNYLVLLFRLLLFILLVLLGLAGV